VAVCAAAETPTGGASGTAASAPEEGLAAAMGLMRQSTLLGFFRRGYSDATIFQWIFRRRFDPVRRRKERERRGVLVGNGRCEEGESARRGVLCNTTCRTRSGQTGGPTLHLLFFLILLPSADVQCPSIP
jgi:hypothetical protein